MLKISKKGKFITFAINELLRLCPFFKKTVDVSTKYSSEQLSLFAKKCPIASKINDTIVIVDGEKKKSGAFETSRGASLMPPIHQEPEICNLLSLNLKRSEAFNPNVDQNQSLQVNLQSAEQYNYEAAFKNALEKIHSEGRYRYFARIKRKCGEFPNAVMETTDGIYKNIKIWCSNDYLGMSQNSQVIEASVAALLESGCGAGGTRNISGTTVTHEKLEKEIADWHHKERALLFSSGYVANEAAISALGNLLPNLIIFSDSCNHASIIHGIRSSKCEKHIFRHNDINDLYRKISRVDSNRPKLIVFESIYSMSGNIANIQGIVNIAKRFNALTYIDEVHAVGMYGKSGAGVAEEFGILKDIDIVNGTLGKAIGVFGGYVCGAQHLIDSIRSVASGFIFTTAIPPTVVAGALKSIQYLKRSSLERDIQKLRVNYLKNKLRTNDFPFIENKSHIISILINNAMLCKKVTDELLNNFNIYVQPINYPTVPKGSERIRLTVTPLHTEDDMDELVAALKKIWTKFDLKMADENNNLLQIQIS